MKSLKFVKFHTMRKMREFSIDKPIVKLQQKSLGKIDIPNTSAKKIEVNPNDLTEKGYTDLGVILDQSEIDTILKHLDSLECLDPFRRDLGTFKKENIPNETHVANYKREELVKINPILELANNSYILNAVQEFLGAKPTISNVNLWWSTSGKKQAEQAQLFHRDADDYKFCKLFIYLTDVGLQNGPHVYVEGSSASNKLKRVRRYQDQEIFDAFGEDKVKYFTGKKGSSFMVDTYGFHKGLLPNEGNRLLLQVQYSLNPIGIENYQPVSVTDSDYNAYINRLILK